MTDTEDMVTEFVTVYFDTGPRLCCPRCGCADDEGWNCHACNLPFREEDEAEERAMAWFLAKGFGK